MDFSFKEFDYRVDLDRQRELFKDSFPETAGDPIQSEKHYMWKFHSLGTPPSWEYICENGSDMVGYYAALPYRYKIGNVKTYVGMVCDVMTSSGYRGKGIFTKLGRYSTQELSNHVPFTMGYPIRPEVIPGHLKIGWDIAFDLPLYIKFLKSNSILNRYHLKLLYPLGNLFLKLYNSIVRQNIGNEFSYSVSNSIDIIDDFESFVEKWQTNVDNALIKESSFYKWRFSAPSREYSFLTIKKGDDTVGLVVLRKIVKYDVPSLCLVDYMVTAGNEHCHGYINHCLKNIAREQKAEAIMTMMSKISAKKYKLFSNGFLKSPFTFKLIIKNLTNQFSKEQLFDENKWHLMWVDSDDL